MRRFSIRILGIVLCLLLVGCGQKEGQTEDAVEQFFEATVLEISEYYLLVEPVEGSSERNSADQIEVSTSRITDEKSLEYLTDAKVDDKVKIGYTNGIAESYPAQINDVLEITLVERPEEVAWAKIPMVMVNDKLYYDTGKNSTIEGRCGNMDGEISSSVSGTETPTENNQSNFGSGYDYQYGIGDTIEVYMNENWRVFEYRSGDGSQVKFMNEWYNTDDLSEKTIEWIHWYNGLTEEEQLSVDSIPADLIKNMDIEVNNAEADK